MAKQMRRLCGNCGAKAVRQVNLKDSWFNEPWKDYPRVFLSHDVLQYQCEKCGEYAGSRDSAAAFDEAVQKSIQDQVAQFIVRIKKKSRLSLVEIAARIPMGYQHLSDLKNHRSFPSYHFWALLHSIYKNPDLLDQLDPRSDEAPLSRIG